MNAVNSARPSGFRQLMGMALLLTALFTLESARADTPATNTAQYISWTRKTVSTSPGTPRGYLEYQNSCAVCHGPMPERPGTRALAAKYHGALPAMLEDRRDLQPAFIRAMVRGGVSLMPPFRKTEVSDEQLDAIVAYLTRPRN